MQKKSNNLSYVIFLSCCTLWMLIVIVSVKEMGIKNNQTKALETASRKATYGARPLNASFEIDKKQDETKEVVSNY